MVRRRGAWVAAVTATLLTSPAEPPTLRKLGYTSLATEEYGADFLIVSPEGVMGIQRKQFPGDFLSSIFDGRMTTVITRLTATSFPIIVLEGRPQWTTDGVLLGHHGGEFRRSTLHAMEMSLAYNGIAVVWTEHLADTAEFIMSMVEWWAKPEHDGFRNRPGPGRSNDLGQPTTDRDWGVHVLQGFDGIGYQLAQRIWDKFNRLPLRWDITRKELGGVRGVGPKKLDALTRLISTKEDDE